jgi:hypothetical protein
LAPVFLDLVSERHISSSKTPIAHKEGVKEKSGILLKLLPSHVQLNPPQLEDYFTIGSTGIIPVRGRDTRLWEETSVPPPIQ